MLDKAEQRSQRAAARLNRVRSALTQEVRGVMATNLSVHAASPVEESGQLPFLGSSLGAFVQGRELAKLTGGWSATATAIDVWTVYLLTGDKLFASQSMDAGSSPA